MTSAQSTCANGRRTKRSEVAAAAVTFVAVVLNLRKSLPQQQARNTRPRPSCRAQRRGAPTQSDEVTAAAVTFVALVLNPAAARRVQVWAQRWCGESFGELEVQVWWVAFSQWAFSAKVYRCTK